MDGTGAILTAVMGVVKQKGLQKGDELTHILGFPIGKYPTKLIKLMANGTHSKKDQSMQFKVSRPWTKKKPDKRKYRQWYKVVDSSDEDEEEDWAIDGNDRNEDNSRGEEEQGGSQAKGKGKYGVLDPKT